MNLLDKNASIKYLCINTLRQVKGIAQFRIKISFQVSQVPCTQIALYKELKILEEWQRMTVKQSFIF